MHLQPEDEQELSARGISQNYFLEQVHRFRYGTKHVKLERPCTKGDGIIVLNASEGHRLLGIFESFRKRSTITRFIPASGAASRMFRHLYNYNPRNLSELTEEFILNFRHFPFYDELRNFLQSKNILLGKLIQENRWSEIFEFIVGENGLNYGNAPKGLVIFHKYASGGRTAYEEHIIESLEYARDKNNSCHLHFTLSPNHLEQVQNFIREILQRFQYDQINIDCSVQDPSTESIAFNGENELMRDEQGKLLFRPAGHGALIRNLNRITSDIVFIKNIDNVTTDHLRSDTVFFKQALAGLMCEIKNEVFSLLQELENNSEDALENALEFIQNWFQPGLPIDMSNEKLRQYAIHRLDRPLRVCGMVRNEGEPGGGPFWVKMPDGHISKQIVEKTQVDTHDSWQSKILSAATHFNPVDIVCSIKDRHGKNYDLEKFVDRTTGFLSEKFHEGKVIRAIELPGLWNGSMALWNTIFVEVPVSTFTPAKTVNDLLRPGHQ